MPHNICASTEGLGEWRRGNRRLSVLVFLAATASSIGGAIVLYRFFPDFLLQHHDGMHAYALLRTLFRWSGFAIGTTVSPMEGMMTFSYPLNVHLTPHLWPFAFFDDPNQQIFWIYVFYAAILYASCHFLFGAMRVPAIAAVPAAFLTVLFWTTQQDPHIAGLQGGLLYFVNFVLGLFFLAGRFGWRANLLVLVAFMVAVMTMLSADTSTSVLGFPTLLVVGAAAQLASPRREFTWKVITAIAALAALVVAGFPDYMMLLFRGTARIYFGGEISLQARSFHVAGIPYHPSDFASGLYVLAVAAAIVILAVSRVVVVPRLLHYVTFAIAALLIAWAVIGYLYVDANLPWIGPAPWYYQWSSYPFMALLPIYGVYLASRLEDRAKVVHVSFLAGTAALALLVWTVSVSGRPATTVTLCVIMIIGLSICFVLTKHRILLFTAGCLIVYLAVQTPFVWADKRADVRDRLAIRSLPITEFLAARVALAPRDSFRGYIDDYYSGGRSQPNMLGEILEHWHNHMRLYGNGLHTFGWQSFYIPTLSQYNTFITPDYLWFYSRIHNQGSPKQTVSMMALTKPDLRMLAAMGARYLVTNEVHPEIDAIAPRVFSWEGLEVHELANPNLMSYSPTKIDVVPSWSNALDEIAAPTFDPTRSIILDEEPPESGPFQSARTLEARFHKNGFQLRVQADGPAIVLLPIQYSHCYQVTQGSAYLMRANVAMTALFVRGSGSVEATLRFGPFGHSACRRRDLEDLDRHLPASTVSSN